MTDANVKESEKSARGGARLNSGKKMPSGAKAIKKTITIDPADEQTLVAFGGGLSVGIRLAAQLIREKKILKK